MTPLCRHILAAGRACPQPAVNGSRYCRHHGEVKKHTRRRPRSPNDFTFTLPLAYPEDRAAIQFNLTLVMQALNDHKIDSKTANSFDRLLRSCRLNLGNTPLLEPDTKNAVQRVILTPEGEEIAPPREVLEEGEAAPLHHKGCPCQRCAEEFRGAQPEQHHADCKCGLCDEPTNTGAPCLAETWEDSEPASALNDQNAGTGDENGCPILDAPFAARVGEHESLPSEGAKRVCLDGQSRTAPAKKLHSYELTDSVTEEEKFFNDIYREHITKHKAEYTARAHAAIEAGLEPPPCEPFDPNKIESKAERLYKETMAQVEKNREAARLSWNRLHPDRPVEYTPYVSWADEEELRREQWKKAREEEAERSRAAASVAAEAPVANVSLPAS